MGGFGAISYASRRPQLLSRGSRVQRDPRHPPPHHRAALPRPVRNLAAADATVTPLGYDALALFGDPAAQRAVWAAHNPADLVANLRGTKLFVSCNEGCRSARPPGTDPSGILVQLEGALFRQNQEFIARATSLGLDNTVDLYGAGTRTWPYWARDEKAFPLLMRAIGA